MSDPRIRRLITLEAARMMYDGTVTEYFNAKRKAAARLRIDHKPTDLPSNAEIREAILSLARMTEGDSRTARLLDMRLDALLLMRALARYSPRLIGSVLTGHIRRGSDIDLHLFAGSTEGIASVLDDLGLYHEVERKHVRKDGVERVFTHVHVRGRHPIELTVYAPELIRFDFKSSITGRSIEKATTGELERLLAQEYPELDVEAELEARAPEIDTLDTLRLILLPLSDVKQSPKYHPEGDVLFHSLQVYDHARKQAPWDLEFLLAALLHDVGKGIDPRDHVAAGVAALEGLVPAHTLYLIAHHMEAQQALAGTIGHKARVRLRHDGHWDELLALARCDRAGRVPGAEVPELDAVIGELRELQSEIDGWNAEGAG